MKQASNDRKSGIIIQKEVNYIRKELVRKSIHLAACFVPSLLLIDKNFVLISLTSVLVLYSVAEFLRIKGIHIVLVSALTEVAARKRDENHFVLGPVTLAVGVLLSIILFDEKIASISIYALAFGDGLASLAGRIFGKHLIPCSAGKTIEGSVTCFLAILVSTYVITNDIWLSLLIAFAGTIIEVLPIKDFDNVIIPIVLGFITQFYFHI